MHTVPALWDSTSTSLCHSALRKQHAEPCQKYPDGFQKTEERYVGAIFREQSIPSAYSRPYKRPISATPPQTSSPAPTSQPPRSSHPDQQGLNHPTSAPPPSPRIQHRHQQPRIRAPFLSSESGRAQPRDAVSGSSAPRGSKRSQPKRNRPNSKR